MIQILMLAVTALLLLVGLYWLTGRVLALYRLAAGTRNMRILRVLAAILLVILGIKWHIILLAAIHFMAVMLVTDGAAAAIRCLGKRRKRTAGWNRASRIYRSGVIQLLTVCLILGYGYYNLGHPVKTEYTVISDKLSGDYEMVFLADTHYGTIQDPQALRKMVADVNSLKPDFIVLGGDIVEEGTSGSDMREAFQLLGRLKSRYGSYYVYGNHDRQTYTKTPAYTEKELAQVIEKNGITILTDRYKVLNQELILAGREDISRGGSQRLCSRELLKRADSSKFLIMADHQPLEAEENAAQGVDLQVSGHTHAGQIFPIGWLLRWSGSPVYGLYRMGGCRVIVSSGFAGWGFPIRTQERSEYVVIHLKKETKGEIE